MEQNNKIKFLGVGLVLLLIVVFAVVSKAPPKELDNPNIIVQDSGWSNFFGAIPVLNKKEADVNTGTTSVSANYITPLAPVAFQPSLAKVSFDSQKVDIKPEIAQNFSLSEVKNIPDMEKKYGFTFTKDELVKLEQNKFIIKNLLDTNLVGEGGVGVPDNGREFIALYKKIIGDSDYKSRTQADTVFVSSDSMMNLFSILSVELLKETENKYLFEQTFSITKIMYDQASVNLKKATSATERNQWVKIRNYFAVPYVLLSTSIRPLTADEYWKLYRANGIDVDTAKAEIQAKDKDVDSYSNTTGFVKGLGLDTDSEKAVLADLKNSYDAKEARGVPSIFETEFNDPIANIQVKIPFTLFKPRGTYTSSSLRRQYFRVVQWYQQIPLMLSSKELTSYAVGIGKLMNDSKDAMGQYKNFSSLIAFIVGESDDSDASDYAAAVSDLGIDKAYDKKILGEYLNKRKPSAKIKALPVNINPDAGVTVADEMQAILGMRFMSQKFIPDSYWTSKLTQGDEAPEVNGQSLPDKASSLEVMSILGSLYANKHLSDLPFYFKSKGAVDTRLAELKSESQAWGESYWQSNLYTSTLWTISGLFNWLTDNHSVLPQFMQSPLWEAKTLLTASGFWTELRHTSLLYAKQSFAEKGGGGDDSCDTRKVPDPAKGYVEPQAEAYDRLFYAAKRLVAEYKARGFDLQNLAKLENYIALLDIVREYTKLELENNSFSESSVSIKNDRIDNCVENFISPDSKIERENSYYSPVSRWEELRLLLVRRMEDSLPLPVEGPVLPIKDKRTAVVADVHTDMNGGVLEEGTGVPRVIFVAVKDINGPRLAVGFTYSQYETISNDRLTDEDWQKNFYTDNGGDYSITYTSKNNWPDINKWFQELLGNK
ncbi:MAG: DUF3160 domain-containing protein [bacterium]